ncbi:MAG: hypothetical protein WCO35_01860 [Candidatus Nomurabacteria bacterium]
MELKEIENEIIKIKERNKKVELDKDWEKSKTRNLFLIITTYMLASLLLIVIKNSNPFINALIPTLGYFISVQSLPFIKKWWIKNK